MSAHHRHGVYLFIMEYIGNGVLKMKHIAFITNREKISSVHILVEALKALALCNKTSEALYSVQ